MKTSVRLDMFFESQLVASSDHRNLDEARAKMNGYGRHQADTAYVYFEEAVYTFRRKGPEWGLDTMVVGRRTG